jgi:hypothetical protein
VGTSSVPYALGNTEGYNQGDFYAAGRYWAWYTDGSNELITSSPDGVSWSSPTVITPGTGGAMFAGVFDGTNFHYVSSHSSSGGKNRIVYRRGKPNSDGTITWSYPEQAVVVCGSGVYACDDAAIGVDSTGHPWVGYSTPLSDCTGCLPSYPYVTKDANNDGTWATASGFPVELSDVGSGGTGIGDWGETIIPLSNQEVYVLFGHGASYLNGTGSSPIFGELYNSGFGPVQTVASSPLLGNMIFSSAVAFGGNIYLVFLTANSRTNMADAEFVEWLSSSGTWSPEQVIWPSLTGDTLQTSGMNVPALTVDGSGNLYLFFMGTPISGEVYYMQYSAATETWGQPTYWLSDTIMKNDQVMVFPEAYGGNIGFSYEAGQASPYNIRFAIFLSSPSSSTSTTSSTSTASSTVSSTTTSSTSTTTSTSTSTTSSTSTTALSQITVSVRLTTCRSATGSITLEQGSNIIVTDPIAFSCSGFAKLTVHGLEPGMYTVIVALSGAKTKSKTATVPPNANVSFSFS